MELIYLWVEEYKNIKNQGFNFSPRFMCEYDEVTKKLTIKEKKDYVSIFPSNINVTAIVGENGAGKSSIGGVFETIKFINCNKDIGNCIFIITHLNTLYAYNDTNIVLNFDYKNFTDFAELKRDHDKCQEWTINNESKADLSNKLQQEYEFLTKANKPLIKNMYFQNSDENLFIIGKNIFTILSEFSSRDNHITGNTYRTIRPLERGDINNYESIMGGDSYIRFYS